MFHWPFSFPRFIMHLFCLMCSGLLIYLNKMLFGTIRTEPIFLFTVVINFYYAIYLLIGFFGVIKKINNYESKIVQKKLKQNFDFSPINFSNNTSESKDCEVMEYANKMKQAEKTWKSTPKSNRNDFEKLLYYQHLTSVNYSIIKIFYIIAFMSQGCLMLNTKISAISFSSFVSVVLGFSILSFGVFIYLNKKQKKYKKATTPKKIRQLLIDLDINID